jgi:hypothetical protein
MLPPPAIPGAPPRTGNDAPVAACAGRVAAPAGVWLAGHSSWGHLGTHSGHNHHIWRCKGVCGLVWVHGGFPRPASARGAVAGAHPRAGWPLGSAIQRTKTELFDVVGPCYINPPSPPIFTSDIHARHDTPWRSTRSRPDTRGANGLCALALRSYPLSRGCYYDPWATTKQKVRALCMRLAICAARGR